MRPPAAGRRRRRAATAAAKWQAPRAHRLRRAASSISTSRALAESRPVVARGAAGVAGDKGVAYAAQDVSYEAPIAFPPHERAVEIEIDLGLGGEEATVIGADLTHEYVATNADYRS